MKTSKLYILLFSLFFVSFGSAQITLPAGASNQKSMVTQHIGSVAKVTIIYNSPSVKGRSGKIWGGLVPWGLAPNNFGTASKIPWRVGANENTTIEISHPMLVNDAPLVTGKYGLHIIPNENEPWVIIFSKASDAWGSYFYNETEDALRIKATPVSHSFKEFMTFDFIDRGANSATVALIWDNLSLPFTFEVIGNSELQLAKIRSELTGQKGFIWQNYVSAINYCVSHKTNLEEALEWADYVIGNTYFGAENFQTLSAKANVLIALNRTEEADKIMDQALRNRTTEALEIHNYGRQMLALKRYDRALEVLKYNYEQFNGEWPTTVGMMRGFSAVGNYPEALKYANLALDQASDELNRNYLEGAIEKLKKNEPIN